MKKKLSVIVALIIWLIPILYLLKIYSSISQTVPVHFGLDGKPNRYGGKEELIWLVGILSAVSIGVYLLIRNLPRIDPKKTAGYSASTSKKLASILVIFLSALQLVIINATTSGSFSISRFMIPLLGLLFAFLGNLMHSVKPNYFFGIRTPWALENEDTWRATHQLASKLWLAGGIAITIAALLSSYKTGFIILLVITTIITLIPVVFSYQYYKKNKI